MKKDTELEMYPDLLNNIDWSELRNQKKELLLTIEYVEKINPELAERLTGILNLIDSIQDYAVDELNIDANLVFDIDLEEKRDEESPEEKFARENAETIFDMHVEGTGLYENDEMSRLHIEMIVDDKHHKDIMISIIKENILNDVLKNPNNFQRDPVTGELTYDSDMYDYGYAIERYCLEQYYKNIDR